MTVSEILNETAKQRCSEEILKILLDDVIRDKRAAESNLSEARASLRAIHKINAGVKQSAEKTKAISALSEV